MLSPSTVANARPRESAYKLRDGRGLYLLVTPAGGRLWRFDYRRPGTGKRNTLSLGAFPEITLAKARERREAHRRLLAEGIDPGARRKAEAEAAASTFEAIAREWFERFSRDWAPAHAERIIRRLERDVFPWIGERPVAELTASEILACLRRIEGRGAIETAHRAHQNVGQILRYAVATERATGDVSCDLRGALPPWKPQHFPSITEPAAVGGLLRAIDAHRGTFQVSCALRLAPLVFLRPGELRRGEWTEIDLGAAEWRIPGERMKGGQPHIVPLSRQALAILDELRPLTGRGR
ncbi:MAG: integrase arm-type DNA-binding domain-containing protein [Gammaproteobacteria bacterium]|nr:integrase arm-type DNA-binding domain-containing protein [Gammaproteobacteria bacterium]